MKSIYKSLLQVSDWESFFRYSNTLTKQEKGAVFEKLTELIFCTKSTYKSRYKNVWLLRDGVDGELRSKLNLPRADEGIDLIAETYSGKYCSIQCKFKGANESPTRKDVATFLDLSRNHCKNISEQILVHTGTNGIKKTSLLPDSFTQIGLDFWTSLTEEDWRAVHRHLSKNAKKPARRLPRKHQLEAINAAVKYFVKENNSRGKLIMPCGTGKSLTAYWIHQALKSKSTIVAVPSLALIKQSLEDWTKEMLISGEKQLPQWLCVCSDESTGKLTDDFFTDTYSLGIPTTTNTVEIREFLTNKSIGGKIIFTTYQSADKLAKLSKQINFCFDLAILDEAHKTVGNTTKSFATLLRQDSIRIQKRLFMTATERVVKGASDDVLSMDDPKTYGNVFYKLSFKKAIEDNIITDYRIITVLINDSEIDRLIQKNKYVSDKKIKLVQAETKMLTSALALKKAFVKYDLRHTVSFHRSISAAKEFQSLFEKLVSGANSPSVFHISSKLNAGSRSSLLKEFRNSHKALITNARCLTEGVDVPAIDCVLFADEKHSVVDIVQASGRALRRFTDEKSGRIKDLGYIIIPIVINDGETLDELTESSRFKTVTRIVSSLSTQDETIAEELRMKEAGQLPQTSDKIQVIGKLDRVVSIDTNRLSRSIQTKMWEKIGRLNWRSYEESIAFTSCLGLKNVKEWAEYSANGGKPADIPFKPYNAYKTEWRGWNEWLGTNNISNWEVSKQFFTLAEAKIYIRKYCKGLITSQSSYNKWVKNKIKGIPNKPKQMPSAPWQTYKDDPMWKGLGDFLGTGRIASRVIKYLPYKSAKKILKNLSLKNRTEYYKWHNKNTNKLIKQGVHLPKHCNQTYHEEWEGWNIFLNNKNPHGKKYVKWMPFKEARAFVRKLGLKSTEQWKLYCRGELKNLPEKPYNIPVFPHRYYKKEGYTTIMDWLGKNEIRIDRNVVSFREAKAFVVKLKLQKSSDWYKYIKGKLKHLPKLPKGYPQHPTLHYKDHRDWKGLGEFLGIENKFNREYLPYSKAKQFVLKLSLKGQLAWRDYCKSGKRPSNIPANPDKIYKGKGWSGYGDWLGTGSVSKANIQFMKYRDARSIVSKLGINGRTEYIEWWRSKGKLITPPLPAKPDNTYKEKGWISWESWLNKKS